jgi:hypothetical protein
MKRKKAIAIVSLVVGLALLVPVSTTSQSGIIVDGADSVQDTSTVYSPGLVSSTQSVAPRVAVEYAHSTAPQALAEPPTTLQSFLDSITERVVAEYANSTAPRALTEPPTALRDLINSITERVVAEYANSNRVEVMDYPLELMNDTTPPQISDITASAVGSDSATITWTTDEFATSTVLYGTQSGTYSETVSDSLYVKQHEVTLSELVPGATNYYYYVVRSSDQSDNTATSAEHSFEILGGTPGDCNGDGAVDAGDISALVLEIFDGDGSDPADTPGGTFPGDPVGCDANCDGVVDAGDISCVVLIIFNGPGACGGGCGLTAMTGPSLPSGSAALSDGPVLTIPDQVPASPGGMVTLPVNFTANGNSIASMIFSVDYDQTWLTFDPTDSDSDGIPDTVTLDIPSAFNASVTFDGGDTDGELDFFIADTFPPLASLPDGAIVSMTLNVGSPPSVTEAAVNFSQDPVASFGDTSGQSVPGTTDDGSVLIASTDTYQIYLPLLWKSHQ